MLSRNLALGDRKRGEEREKEREEVVRPIHQLPRLAASRTYFLASLRRHVGGGVALCWFYEALKNGPRARSSLSSPLWPPFLPLPPRPRLRTFCRVAITRQSPLPFGPLMDAHCVGTGVPVDGPATESARFRPASSTPKRHASSFVNRPAARRKEGFRPCVRARSRIYRTKARRKFHTLFRAGGIIVRSRPAFTSGDISRG